MHEYAAILKEVVTNFYDVIIVRGNPDQIFFIQINDSGKKNVEKLVKQKFSKVKSTFIKLENLFENKVLLKVLYSGYSIKKRAYVYETLGITPLLIVTYSLKNLGHSQKTLFGYALKGRKGEKGTLDKLHGKVMGRNNVIIPRKHFDKLKEFLEYWKVNFNVKRIIEVDFDNQQKRIKKLV